MKRIERKRLLCSALITLACGGGCMTMPYAPGVQQDLSWAGADEHTRARLAGHADPRPSGPEPTTGLRGELLIYEAGSGVDLAANRWGRGLNIRLSARDYEQLRGLPGITGVRPLPIDWRAFNEALTEQTNPKRILLDQARDAKGDLILVYTYAHKADAADLTLTLAQYLMLGFAPTVVVTADATVEAVLIDAHTGFVYAIGEGEGNGLEIANGWSREMRQYDGAEEAVEDAFGAFVDRLEDAWPSIQAAYE